MKVLKNRKLLACLLILVMALAFSACGKAAKSDYGNNVFEEDSISQDSLTDTTENATTDIPDDRKLIYTAEISVETEDLDTLLSNIEKRIAEVKGYVETSNINNGSSYSGRRYRSASLTIRIPVKSFNAFIDNVGKISNVVSSEKSAEDVTLNYVATESRKKALEAEETRLLEFMAKAETMEDLLTVEERLTEVRSELETVTSTLRALDNQIDYATIKLEIDEVKEYTDTTEPKNIWQRMGGGFVNSFKNIGIFFKEAFVFLVVASPYLITAAIIPLLIVVVVLLVVRANRRKKAKATEERKKE